MKQQESTNSPFEDEMKGSERARQTMPKSARLRHRTLVNHLFEKGESLYVYPLRGIWRVLSVPELAASFRTGVPEGIGPVQLMVTIPKKKRRHAVDRVRMRRLVKEVFRKHRRELVALEEADPEWRTLSLALIYIADKNHDYRTMERKMDILFKKLFSSLQERNGREKREPEA